MPIDAISAGKSRSKKLRDAAGGVLAQHLETLLDEFVIRDRGVCVHRKLAETVGPR